MCGVIVGVVCVCVCVCVCVRARMRVRTGIVRNELICGQANVNEQTHNYVATHVYNVLLRVTKQNT